MSIQIVCIIVASFGWALSGSDTADFDDWEVVERESTPLFSHEQCPLPSDNGLPTLTVSVDVATNDTLAGLIEMARSSPIDTVGSTDLPVQPVLDPEGGLSDVDGLGVATQISAQSAASQENGQKPEQGHLDTIAASSIVLSSQSGSSSTEARGSIR